MLIEEWDRTLLGMTKREYSAMKRKKKFRVLLNAVLETAGGVVFFVSIAVFAWLCAAASGYHWE